MEEPADREWTLIKCDCGTGRVDIYAGVENQY